MSRIFEHLSAVSSIPPSLYADIWRLPRPRPRVKPRPALGGFRTRPSKPCGAAKSTYTGSAGGPAPQDLRNRHAHRKRRELDFNDVLIRPSVSTLNSRTRSISLILPLLITRAAEWKGFPVIAREHVRGRARWLWARFQ